jgi:hypothetical protein
MPIAIIMGLIMRYKKNSVLFASILGGILLIAGIIGGHGLMQNPAMNNLFSWDIKTISIAIPLIWFSGFRITGMAAFSSERLSFHLFKDRNHYYAGHWSYCHSSNCTDARYYCIC